MKNYKIIEIAKKTFESQNVQFIKFLDNEKA